MNEPKLPPETADVITLDVTGERAETEDAPKKPRLEPTRYGDWELNGKCVDF